jgi:hypothetical protein
MALLGFAIEWPKANSNVAVTPTPIQQKNDKTQKKHQEKISSH